MFGLQPQMAGSGLRRRQESGSEALAWHHGFPPVSQSHTSNDLMCLEQSSMGRANLSGELGKVYYLATQV